MKKFPLITLFLFLGLFTTRPLLAQQQGVEPDFLELVSLDLWPDYDRPELLVIETAVLPETTALPAGLRLPLPPGATINAVAFADNQGGLLEIPDYRVEAGQVVLIAPARTIRLEYYLPYPTGSGEQREITFAWTALFDTNRLEMAVQEPANSTGFALTPGAGGQVVTRSGVRYHQLPSRTVLAGETATVTIAYNLLGGQLTASSSQPANAPAGPVASTGGSDFWAGLQANWPWLAGTLLLAVAIVTTVLGWREWREKARRSGRPRKPARQRGSYCPNCGVKAEATDRFCRSCGQPLG